MEKNGNVEVLIDEGVVVTGDPIFTYKGYSIFVGIIQTKEGNDLPHYLIFNDAYGVIEGASSKIVEARTYCVVLADAAEEQEKKLKKGEALSASSQSKSDKSNWN